MKLRHGGLGRRLGGSFLIFAILIIVAAGTGWWGLGQQHAAQQRIEHRELVKDAIGHIATVVGRISDYRTVIAAAVEEQSVTTAEMNRTSPKRRPPPRSGVSRSQMSGELHAPVARFQL